MPATKEEQAQYLANIHYQVETGMKNIFRINGPATIERKPDEPIKLLEVNENTVPSGILPLQFGPSKASGRDFSCIIVEVTPEEYSEIQSKKLKLPHGWRVGQEIPRPTKDGDR